MASSDPNLECCPPFDPTNWDDKIVEWKNKLFLKDNVFCLFYMPVNFGGVMKRVNEKLTNAGATMSDNLGLSDHTSKWNMDLYIAVDKEVAGAQNTTLTGKFYSKVYEGPFRDTGKWMKDYDSLAESKGLKIKKYFMWYTTCPKCAKKYGKNYVVVIGQVE
jgi:hypothetical protein